MQDHASVLQAVRAWFHSAHHVTKGVGFNGDHELYGEIYSAAEGFYDTVVEKSIGIMGCECVASPMDVMTNACTIISVYPNPVGMSSLAIASTGMRFLSDYNHFLSDVDDVLEKAGKNTLGLNDFHASTANQIETFLYKLGQRIKQEI